MICRLFATDLLRRTSSPVISVTGRIIASSALIRMSAITAIIRTCAGNGLVDIITHAVPPMCFGFCRFTYVTIISDFTGASTSNYPEWFQNNERSGPYPISTPLHQVFHEGESAQKPVHSSLGEAVKVHQYA